MRAKKRSAELVKRQRLAIQSGKFWDPVKTLAGIRKKMECMSADSGGRMQMLFLYGYKSKAGKTYIKRFALGRGGHKMCENKKLIGAWKTAVLESLAKTPAYIPGGVARS